MKALWSIIASTPLEDLASGKAPAKTPLFGPLLTDILLILAAVILLTVVLLYWAAYVRKPKRNNSPARASTIIAVPVPGRDPEKQQSRSGRRKWRRRRREHRPRNPTLAETGGLPPPKPEAGQQLPD